MRNLLRRLRGTIGMGLTWAVAWGIGGGMIELISNLWPALQWPDALDMWIQTLAIVGFMAGVLFAAVLWAAEGRRRFDELSPRRFMAWGLMGGMLLGAIAIALGMGRTALPNLLLRAVVIMGPPAVLSAVSAYGSLALARAATDRVLLES